MFVVRLLSLLLVVVSLCVACCSCCVAELSFVCYFWFPFCVLSLLFLFGCSCCCVDFVCLVVVLLFDVLVLCGCVLGV